MSYFSVYLQSGKGWYHAHVFSGIRHGLEPAIVIDKADMKVEGNPDGWNQIKTIRIAAWRLGIENTEFFVKRYS